MLNASLAPLSLDDQAAACRRLDASGRSLYQMCPAKFFFEYVLGLGLDSGEGQGAWARDFGTAIHAGMEEDNLDNAIASFHLAYDRAFGANGEPTPKGPTEEQVDEARTGSYANREKAHIHAPDRGEAMLRGYWAKYRAHDPLVTLHRELKLMAKFADGLTYYGKVDRIVTWRDNPDAPLTADYKTTGASGGASSMITNPFPQQEGYLWLAIRNELIPATEDYEFIVDVLTKDTTLDGRNYKSGRSFERCQEPRSAEDLVYWEAELAYVWMQILQNAQDGMWPEAAPFACKAYNTPCIYLPICKARGNEAEQARLMNPATNDLYVHEPWQPLEGFDV